MLPQFYLVQNSQGVSQTTAYQPRWFYFFLLIKYFKHTGKYRSNFNILLYLYLGFRDANSLPCLLQFCNLKVIGYKCSKGLPLPSPETLPHYRAYVSVTYVLIPYDSFQSFTPFCLSLNVIRFEFHPDHHVYFILHRKSTILSLLSELAFLLHVPLELPDSPHKALPVFCWT